MKSKYIFHSIRQHAQYLHRYSFVLILALICCSTACRNDHPEKTQEDRENLQKVDYAVDNGKPDAKELIEKGMAEAEDSLTYYEYYARYIKYYCLSSTPDSMKHFEQRVLAYAEGQKKSPRIYSLLSFVYTLKGAHSYNFLHTNDSVIENYQKGYEYSLLSDDKERAPLICANMGDAYALLNKLPDVAHWYRRALFLVDSLHLPRQKYLSIHAGTAATYLKFGDFKQTKFYLDQVKPYFDMLDPNMKAYYLTTLGNYHYYRKEYGKSKETFIRLKQDLEKSGENDTFSMYYCLLNLSDIYLNLGKTDSATLLLDKVEPVLRKNAQGTTIYYINTIRLGIAIKEHNTPLVKTLIRETDNEACAPFQIRQIRNRYLCKHYEQTGNYQAAYLNFKRDIQLNDSLEHKRMNLQMADIMDRFMQDTLRLHHDLIIQQQKSELQDIRTWTMAATCVAAVLALALTIWIMRSNKRELQDQMSIMQLKMVSARNRISPHFTFNVLNNSILNSHGKEAQELMDMARLIRANLDLSVKSHVTLHEELEFVQQYVKVESRLIEDPFSFNLEVGPEVNLFEVQIPSMFLQILTENAFVHGLRGWSGEKRLTVRIEKTTGGTLVSAIDNGRGFDIRSTGHHKRMGLGIITQTIAIVNERNKQKMRFSIHNLQDEDGKTCGCQSSLFIPDNINFIIGGGME